MHQRCNRGTVPPPAPLARVAGLDLDDVGFVIVGLFVLAWPAALAVWRLGRVEERWEGRLRSPVES